MKDHLGLAHVSAAADRREMAAFWIGMEAKNARKKLRRSSLVVGRDNGVVEGDGHRKTSRLPQT